MSGGLNLHQLWVPPGFAHGYLTLENDCEVLYKVTDYYAPECDRGIAWNDPALAIEWPLPSTEIILSQKDSAQPLLAEIPIAFRLTEGC
jgi:dTDP-4-dehydrorhamnose 3,5-epimerase